MGLPRFTPSRLFANPRDFGRNRIARPHSQSGLSPTQAAWAWFQHRAALAVFEELRARRESLAALAGLLGEDSDWLKRKLYGRAPADLGDVLGWALLLGPQIVPPIDSESDLRPGRVA